MAYRYRFFDVLCTFCSWVLLHFCSLCCCGVAEFSFAFAPTRPPFMWSCSLLSLLMLLLLNGLLTLVHPSTCDSIGAPLIRIPLFLELLLVSLVLWCIWAMGLWRPFWVLGKLLSPLALVRSYRALSCVMYSMCLLSVATCWLSSLRDHHKVLFNRDQVLITQYGGRCVAVASHKDNLYMLKQLHVATVDFEVHAIDH